MSDYSPPYTDEDAKLDARKDKADKKIMKIKLGRLTVEDLFRILKAYDHGCLNRSEHDVSLIEGILRRMS